MIGHSYVACMFGSISYSRHCKSSIACQSEPGQPHNRRVLLPSQYSYHFWTACTVRELNIPVLSTQLLSCSSDEVGANEEEPSSLCTCLTMVAPLASAVVRLHLQLQQTNGASQSSATDRLSYPALSALVTACQVKTAVALQGSTQAAVCSADAFKSFWSPATPWWV